MPASSHAGEAVFGSIIQTADQPHSHISLLKFIWNMCGRSGAESLRSFFNTGFSLKNVVSRQRLHQGHTLFRMVPYDDWWQSKAEVQSPHQTWLWTSPLSALRFCQAHQSRTAPSGQPCFLPFPLTKALCSSVSIPVSASQEPNRLQEQSKTAGRIGMVPRLAHQWPVWWQGHHPSGVWAMNRPLAQRGSPITKESLMWLGRLFLQKEMSRLVNLTGTGNSIQKNSGMVGGH